MKLLQKKYIMSELKKYTNFEELKAETKAAKKDSLNEKLMVEFEAFMHLLQHEFSLKKQVETTNGNQHS
jgi:hypothetical protein